MIKRALDKKWLGLAADKLLIRGDMKSAIRSPSLGLADKLLVRTNMKSAICSPSLKVRPLAICLALIKRPLFI